MNQLGLPISLNSSMLLKNFVANQELIKSVSQLFQNQQSSELYIYGSSGNGKTHILQGAVLKSLSDDKNAVFVDCSEPFPEYLIEFIDQISLISFDNVHLIAKEKEERDKYTKDDSGWSRYTGAHTGIIAMCLDEKNLNKVRVSYFNDLETYKKNGSFKKGECNYVVSRKLNQHLYEQLYKKTFLKKKYEIEKKFIDDYVDWTKEIFYVSPKGEMIEVVAMVFFEPNQTNEDGTPKVYTKNV